MSDKEEIQSLLDSITKDVSDGTSEIAIEDRYLDQVGKSWFDAYVDIYTADTEPPTIFHKWVAIFVVAAAMKRKLFVPYESLTIYPNLYVVLVGPSGTGKSVSMYFGEKLMKANGIAMCAEGTTCQALIEDMTKASTESEVTISYRDPITDKLEYREEIMQHCSLTVFSKELAVFFGYNDPYFLAYLTDWYDCGDDWEYKTKSAGSNFLYGMWLNLMGATTQELIDTKQVFPVDAIGSGFTSRLIFVVARDKKQHVRWLEKPSAGTTAIEKLLIKDLGTIHNLSGEFTVTDKARSMFDKWFDSYTIAGPPPFVDPYLSGYCERRRVHCIKLGMIYSAMRSNELVIRDVDIYNAISLLEETEDSMGRVFEGFGGNTLASCLGTLREWLAKEKVLHVAEIFNRFRRDVDIESCRKMLATFVATGYAYMHRDDLDSWIVIAGYKPTDREYKYFRNRSPFTGLQYQLLSGGGLGSV